MSVHELKTWPDYYNHLVDGSKTFEFRRDDRGFKVGDVLHLREWEPTFERYTGREMLRLVTYVLNTSKDFVAMALSAEWQSINTAPLDGTHVLVCDARRPYTAFWGFGQNPPTVGHYFVQGWHLSVNHDGEHSEIQPTHWMPLPSPPMESATSDPARVQSDAPAQGERLRDATSSSLVRSSSSLRTLVEEIRVHLEQFGTCYPDPLEWWAKEAERLLRRVVHDGANASIQHLVERWGTKAPPGVLSEVGLRAERERLKCARELAALLSPVAVEEKDDHARHSSPVPLSGTGSPRPQPKGSR